MPTDKRVDQFDVNSQAFSNIDILPLIQPSSGFPTKAVKGTFSDFKDFISSGYTSNKSLISDGSGKIITSSVTSTELGYVAGVTSSIQSQINSLSSGLSWKGAVRVSSTSNITISSPGATIDSITMVSGNRVLLEGETSGIDNGIYMWNGSAVPMTRSSDMPNGSNVVGMVVAVEEGTFADKGRILTTIAPAIVGTNSLSYSLFGGTTYIGTSNRISVTGNVIDISNSYLGQTSITTLGTITTGTIANGTKILLGSDATGDTYYNGGSGNITRLPIGTTSQILSVLAGLPSWQSTLKDVSSVTSIDWINRLAYDNSGNNIIDWNGLFLLDITNNISISWGGRSLADSVGISSADWDNRLLLDATLVQAIDWQDRVLIGNTGTILLDFGSTVSNSITFKSSINMAFNAAGGTKFGTAINQKLSFWNATPIVQPTSANQGALTDSTTGTPSFTLVDVGVVFSQGNINNNFASINRQLAAIRIALVNTGLIKGS